MRLLKFIFIVGLAYFQSSCNRQSFKVQEQSEAFQQIQAYNNKVDVIIMVDNSPSMSPYQNRFSEEIPSMLEKLNGLKMDYHIAVVTSDMSPKGSGGRFVGSPSFITPSTDSGIDLLKRRVRIGDNGSSVELGLESVRKALSPEVLAKVAPDFLRSDALLAIIFVTNEDDYSSGKPQAFIEAMNRLKPPFVTGVRAWIAHFLGVKSLDDQCATANDSKEVGQRYIEIAAYSGGIQASICDTTLAGAIENIRVQTIQLLSDYHLDRTPVEESIQVWINGLPVPKNSESGWSYVKDENLVRFHGHFIPASDDLIRVVFTPVDAG